jgi:Repeat of unknown function (DUF5650)
VSKDALNADFGPCIPRNLGAAFANGRLAKTWERRTARANTGNANMLRRIRVRYSMRCLLTSGLLSLIAVFATSSGAQQVDIVGPPGSGAFGSRVKVLPNGNIVVTDPMFTASGGPVNAGAVYLYTPDGTLISTLTGSTPSDFVGDGPIVVLANGNFLVSSPWWNNGTATRVGAVTWINAATGLSGQVSAGNSLVGSSSEDTLGYYLVNSFGFLFYVHQIQPLRNGNYVIISQQWDNGTIADAGALTWGNGSTGTAGVVSTANSLVGGQQYDLLGSNVIELSNGNFVLNNRYRRSGLADYAGAVTWIDGNAGFSGTVSSDNSLIGRSFGDQIRFLAELSNGNYVVGSSLWDNDDAKRAGAVTWASGNGATHGVVSAQNSLVGVATNDRVGSDGVWPLSNGNYVVASAYWSNGPIAEVGAVTWVNGSTGVSAIVSPANSLVGATSGDRVGFVQTATLSNGDYVVGSPEWDNGGTLDVGAVTWANGSTGLVGVVSPANSLIGSTQEDRVGSDGIAVLRNGNFVVKSSKWTNGTASEAGAATWVHGGAPLSGSVSVTNSLTGTAAGDAVGHSVFVLSNGNYVVLSPAWSNGAFSSAGAASWGNGSTGVSGPVSAANSLVGSSQFDDVGGYNIIEVANSNYVIANPSWNNGPILRAGSVTWGDGSVGVSGPISASNSLVGDSGQQGDSVSISALDWGNYVILFPYWKNGNNAGAGAVTWANGRSKLVGGVSAENSLIGTSQDDRVGSYVYPLSGGNYAALSWEWDSPTTMNAGAVSFGRSNRGVVGPINARNSVIGTEPNLLQRHSIDYDPTRDQLVVGRFLSNMVTLFRADQLFADGLQ